MGEDLFRTFEFLNNKYRNSLDIFLKITILGANLIFLIRSFKNFVKWLSIDNNINIAASISDVMWKIA